MRINIIYFRKPVCSLSNHCKYYAKEKKTRFLKYLPNYWGNVSFNSLFKMFYSTIRF